MWTFILLFACAGAKRSAEPETPKPPLVPAPESSDYACAHTNARDPIVAQLSAEHPWDEALSGALAGIGLGLVKPNPPGQYHTAPEPTMIDLRWAAAVAGYPSQPLEYLTGRVEAGTYPEGLSIKLESWLQPGDDLGLVRLRKGTEDLWLATRAHSCTGFPTIRREYTSGDALQIEDTKGHWRLLFPNGDIQSGQLPLKVTLPMSGEYWLELRGTHSVDLPLYVDMHIPPTNILSVMEVPLDVPDVITEAVFKALNDFREQEGLDPFEADQMLTAMSAKSLARHQSGEWQLETELERLQRNGFMGGPVHQMACSAAGLSDCLDQLTWNLDNRAALFNPQLRVLGVQLAVTTSRMDLLISMASF
ncbi:MAG: hypothetical protein VXZ96_03405 [Myxococcota bacterium]|nr:hypothetical protein [Myxococcota bacterium]